MLILDAPRRALLPVAALAIAMMLAEGLVAPAWSGTSLGMDLRGVVSEWPEGISHDLRRALI